MTPPRRPVGLRHNSNDLMLCSEQSFEGRHGEGGGSEEDDAHTAIVRGGWQHAYPCEDVQGGAIVADTMDSVIYRNLKFEELPKYIRKLMVRPIADYQADSRWLAAHCDELRQLYPDEYVVIRDATVVGHGPELAGVLAELDCKGIDRRMLVHHYFSTQPEKLIL